MPIELDSSVETIMVMLTLFCLKFKFKMLSPEMLDWVKWFPKSPNSSCCVVAMVLLKNQTSLASNDLNRANVVLCLLTVSVILLRMQSEL